MFNNQRITSLEGRVRLLIEDILEAHQRIMKLETEIVILRSEVKPQPSEQEERENL